MRVVVDTSVFVAGLKGPNGAARQVLRLCLQRKVQPIMGNALLAEMESQMAKHPLWENAVLSFEERTEFLDGFFNVCQWVTVSFLWRPNLQDEKDNHVYELALAGQAGAIVTHNLRDFHSGEVLFPGIRILSPADFLSHFKGETKCPQ